MPIPDGWERVTEKHRGTDVRGFEVMTGQGKDGTIGIFVGFQCHHCDETHDEVVLTPDLARTLGQRLIEAAELIKLETH